MTDPMTRPGDVDRIEDEVMRRLSSDNPKSRHHNEEYADGRSSWRCVPIADIIAARSALLDAARAAHSPAQPVIGGIDVERLARAIARETDPAQPDIWTILGPASHDLFRRKARRIAAEYAALVATPEDQS